MPNWTISPNKAGFSWRVWEGDAEERGHATTKEQAMLEIQESCRRVGKLNTDTDYPYWNTDKLREAQGLIADATHAADEHAANKCLAAADTLIQQVIDDE